MLGFDECCGAVVQVNLREENMLAASRKLVCPRFAPERFGQLTNLFAFPVVGGSVHKSGEESKGQKGLLLIWIHGLSVLVSNTPPAKPGDLLCWFSQSGRLGWMV